MYDKGKTASMIKLTPQSAATQFSAPVTKTNKFGNIVS